MYFGMGIAIMFIFYSNWQEPSKESNTCGRFFLNFYRFCGIMNLHSMGDFLSSFLIIPARGFFRSKRINIKPYKPTQETRENKSENLEHGGKDVKFEQAYNKLKEREGGYTDGKNQKKDEPTNMGIKQSTLDRYSAKYPEKYLPSDVKNLSEAQVKEIYKSEYWDNTRIPEIKNDRIRDAVFDMNVMGGAGKVVQCALNSFLGANLVVDGAIGSETIKSINAIPDSAVNEFMIALKSERIDYLKETSNWETAKNGWTKRTNKY
jgi:hypothetical protein